MAEDFETYLKEIGFEKYLKKIIKKLRNKTIIIYGSGTLFQYIKEKYDISALNIIGISDMKFTMEQEGQECLGYKIVPKDKIAEYNPDIVLVATKNYLSLLESFVLDVFSNTKTKVYPLAKIPLFEMLKKIWS